MKKEKGIIIGAVTAIGAGLLAVILLKEKRKEGLTAPYNKGNFFTLKNVMMKELPDNSSKEILEIPKDEPLENPVFEEDWVKVKCKGKEGYIPSESVYCFKYDPKFFDM